MTQHGWQRTWIRAVTTLLTAAVMVMIFCFSTENAAESDQRSGTISMVVIRVLYPEYETMDTPEKKELYDSVQFAVRKCAHFTEYMLLGLMIRLCLESWFGLRIRKAYAVLLISTVTGTVYACTDELHQLAIDGRFGTWTDVLVDSCGVLAGVCMGSVLVRYVNRKIKQTDA